MRKVRQQNIPAVPKVYETDILNLVHESSMGVHLSINNIAK